MPLPKKLTIDTFAHDFYVPEPAEQYKKAREVVSFIPEEPPFETGGTFFIVNKRLLYSPNCTRYPGVPSPIEENATLWRVPGLSWPTEFRQPRWWSEDTEYLAFFALNPQFEVEPFKRLFESDAHLLRRVRGRGFTMTSTRKLLWVTMERRLNLIVHALTRKYEVHPLRDIITTARLCNAYFPTLKDYAHAFLRSKAWFGVVMAKISFLIAVAHSLDEEPLDMPYRPKWYDFLLNTWPGRYFDVEFLDGVRAVMGKFGPENPRAGVLLNIIVPPAYQFSSTWLKSIGVPVYYFFDHDEAILSANSHRLTRMRPPVVLVDEIGAYLTHCSATLSPVPYDLAFTLGPFAGTRRLMNEPSSQPVQSRHSASNPNVDHLPLPQSSLAIRTPTQLSNATLARTPPPWVAFLEERGKKTELLIKRESPKEKQARLQRESNPPVVNTVVFVWEENDQDSYDRVRVGKKSNDETLASFTQRQKVYNAVFNEWDCGYDFFDEPNSDDDSEYEDVQFASRSPASAAPEDDYGPFSFDDDNDPAVLQPTEDPPPNFAQDAESWITDAATSDMMTLFIRYYGYVPPLIRPNDAQPPLTSSQLTRLRTYVGKTRDDCSDLEEAVLAHIHSFMTSVLRHKTAANEVPCQSMDSWDLVVGNREYLGMAPRIRRMSHIGTSSNGLFLFDFGDQSTEPWYIGVPSIIIALSICRMRYDLTEYEICHKLLHMGVSFYTLIPVRHHIEPALPRRIPYRTRSLDYHFTRRDYEVYVSHRRDVLCNSRASRAALMRGGIIWRLCDFASNRDSVYQGPTKYVTDLGISTSFDNDSLHDDYISPDELDAISGTYTMPTGKGEQTMTVSWWPPESSWSQYYDFDYWTDVMELKFQQRLQELDRGEAQPLPKQQWKTWIRGGSASREAKSSIIHASMAFYEDFTTPKDTS